MTAAASTPLQGSTARLKTDIGGRERIRVGDDDSRAVQCRANRGAQFVVSQCVVESQHHDLGSLAGQREAADFEFFEKRLLADGKDARPDRPNAAASDSQLPKWRYKPVPPSPARPS